jgi:Fe-only nitrogenase accessory protein AnfO
MKIAAYVNTMNEVVSIYEKGIIRLYEKILGIWTTKVAIALDMNEQMNIPEVRMNLKKAVAALGDCKIFLSGEVKGVPYAILEGMGFNIWKSEGSVFEQLEYVAEKETEAVEESKKPKPAPLPVGDIRDGFYRINLADVLDKHQQLTSKQVLLPFMEKTAFQKLEILCDHPPRWLATEFERLKLHGEAESLDTAGHGMKITVVPVT